MISDAIKDTIISHIPTIKSSRSGWYTCNCPICHLRGHNPDRRHRFGLNVNNDGSFGINCFNCSFKTRFVPGELMSKSLIWFLESIGVPEEHINELKFAAFRQKEQQESSISISPISKYNWEQCSLPEGSMSLTEWADAGCTDENFLGVVNYVLSRNLPHVDKLYWSPNKDDMMYKRVIIPFYYKNVIVGYTARYYNSNKNAFIPKYLSKEPENYIYNLDAQDYDRKYCILTEGPIDAMMVSGIACMGNTLNKTKVDIINSLNKQIILCPDRDKSGDTLIKTAIENGWAVSFPKWGENIKDVAEASITYGRLLTVTSILESIVNNPLKIYVSRKLDAYKS